MNPSTADLVSAIEAADAEEVVLLPNNKNVFMAAEQAADHASKVVRVVPTTSLQAGLAAHRSGADAVRAAREVLDAEPGLRVDYVAEADLDGPTLAAAVVVGSTRLIDNVLLEGEA